MLLSDSQILLAILNESSKFPSTWKISAPYAIACAIFPMAIFPLGTRTIQRRWALALYAASEAEVFPVDAHITLLYPSSTAFDTPTVIPLSLKDPVGLRPSNFT